jgi:two-component system, OmpR family, sensor histidine kinase KdpD
MDRQAVIHGDSLRTALPEAPTKPAEPAQARVLALLPTTSHALALVRWADRLAQVAEGVLYCAYFRTSDAPFDGSGERDLRDALELARQMGGQTIELRGDDLPGAMLRFARQKQITDLVVGKPRHTALSQFLRATVPTELLDEASGLRIVVLAEPTTEPRSKASG